ncbi:uncharacterized protein LOC111496482 [Cucurbita maxima]|uniref:Uncharacterized protein LOC111496482 n=1 Tax=Cucurbita maxima TaxID=3661 RepID=A0A6J1KUB9_CUCMA|nr:uncharacterized protein LOC111496482 [Cucurbita maxima]
MNMLGLSFLCFLNVLVMVGSFPTDENLLIHPAISLTLMAAGMVTAIAMITALCGVRSRRSPSPSEASSKTADKKQDINGSRTTTSSTAGATPAAGDSGDDGGETEEFMKELPLPPKMQQVASPSPPSQIAKSASERRLKHMTGMNMEVPRSHSVARKDLEEGGERRKEKMKEEELIWKKTIILGEKCRVSDEEDGVIYEGKGKRISAYHPRSPSSMSISISRQSSAIDAEALPDLGAK